MSLLAVLGAVALGAPRDAAVGVGAGGVLGVSTAGAVAELGGTPGVSAAVGTGAGAATAGALAAWRPADRGPAPGWRLASATAGGAWIGAQVGRIAAPVADGQTLPAIGQLTGQGAGLAAGLLTRPGIPDGRTWATLDGAVLAGHLAGTALADGWALDTDTDRATRAGLELGIGLGAGGLARWRLARAPEQANGARIATGVAYGTVLGVALPSLLEVPVTETAARRGIELGASAGYLAGALLPLPPADPRAATAGLAWSLAGGTLLGGAGGRVPGATGDTVASLGILVGSTAGLVGGLALQPAYGDPADRPIGVPLYLGISQLQAAATGAAVGAWAGAALPDDPSAPTEFGLLAYGAASAAGLAVPALGPLSAGGSAAAGSAGAWGAGLAGAVGHIAGQAPPARRATAAITGEVGTITAGLALAGRGGPALPQVAWVDGLGLVGLGVGTLVSFAVTPEPTWRATGALAGSVVGLGAGLATAGRWGGRDTASPVLPRWNLSRPSRWRAHLSPGPWLGDDGAPGVALTLAVEELRP